MEPVLLNEELTLSMSPSAAALMLELARFIVPGAFKETSPEDTVVIEVLDK
jgi:hypothetical protein